MSSGSSDSVVDESKNVLEDAARLADSNPDYLPSPLKRMLLMFAAFGVLFLGLLFTPLFVVGFVVEDATDGKYGKLLKAPTELGVIMFFVLGLLSLMGERNAMRKNEPPYDTEDSRA